MKNWLLDQKRKPYEALFRLRAEAGRPTEAVDVMERGQSENCPTPS